MLKFRDVKTEFWGIWGKLKKPVLLLTIPPFYDKIKISTYHSEENK